MTCHLCLGCVNVFITTVKIDRFNGIDNESFFNEKSRTKVDAFPLLLESAFAKVDTGPKYKD